MNVKFKNKCKTVLAGITLSITNATVVLAAENKVAKKFSDWVISGAMYLALALCAGLGLKYYSERKITKLVIFIILSGLCIVFIKDPSKLGTIGESLYNAWFE